MEKNKIILIVVLAIVALMFLLAFFGDSNARYSDEPVHDDCDPTTRDITISELKALYSPEPVHDDTIWEELKKLFG